MRDLASGLVFIFATVALSLVAYLAASRFFAVVRDEPHKEMAGAMVTRISALHALILALVFAQEMAAYQRLEVQVAAEGSAIADVYNDAARYDPEPRPGPRCDGEILRIVVEREWHNLGEGKGLDDEAWAEWNRAYEMVLDLQAQTPRQTSLREHMLAALHSISTARDVRRNEAETSIADFFWLAALSGVVLIAVGYYVYPPERQTMTLMALFSAYTGVILFLIFGFSNPYSPPAALSPGWSRGTMERIQVPGG